MLEDPPVGLARSRDGPRRRRLCRTVWQSREAVAPGRASARCRRRRARRRRRAAAATNPTPSASVGSASAIFAAAWRSSSSRWASTSALPPRRAISEANTIVLPHPVGRTISGRRTPRSSARSTAADRLLLVGAQRQPARCALILPLPGGRPVARVGRERGGGRPVGDAPRVGSSRPPCGARVRGRSALGDRGAGPRSGGHSGRRVGGAGRAGGATPPRSARRGRQGAGRCRVVRVLVALESGAAERPLIQRVRVAGDQHRRFELPPPGRGVARGRPRSRSCR